MMPPPLLRFVRRSSLRVLVASLAMLIIPGCSSREAQEPGGSAGKLGVVTTLFPLYDFARAVAGDRAVVTMLLPPGTEPHSFEPRPDDVVRVGKAGLFIYTSRAMEPWAETVIKGVDRKKLVVVEAGEGVAYLRAGAGDDPDHDDHARVTALDPHIWLDFGNAVQMADNILAGFVAADPANAGHYRANAAALKGKLDDLDRRYRKGLEVCGTRIFLHGGHFTFGYLARRYHLDYHALSGVSSESEPSAARMAGMVKELRRSGARYLFAEELLSPRLSETLAAEAGVSVLMLHGAHNLGRDDFRRGVGFIGLMEENLATLQKGLACRAR